MLKLKLQYFGYLMQRADSLEKTLMLGKIEGRRRRGQQRMRWVDGITDSVDMNLSKFRVMVVDKMWSTEEGNGKLLQYSYLENVMNSMKRQKDRTLKDELPRSVGAQHATGDQGRNNSRKKRWSASKNNTQLGM